ncbi:fungal-specific transcription factor domain-containing protein [Entophlyctis helioformis]|nr:fungal-specific transcription factor domain-containing protein [Entophlyctis helioformis]
MRESLACANCVVKKTGCDRKRPSCSACRRSGLACLYRETIPAGRHMSGHHNGVSKKLASSASSAATALLLLLLGLSSPHTPVQHQASSSGQTTQQHMSIARTLQDRIERLEAIVSMHQKVNSLGADDPVNPATGAGASGGSPPLAREDLKAFFIASLRPHLVLLTADQVIFCAAENPLVTYAMCALAALFVPEQFLPLRRARELFLAYFGEAKACMSAAFDDPKPSSVFGLLLLTIASSADRGPKVTYYYGSVVQMAMRIGLNSEEVIASSPESEFYKALMRNIWWSIYILDRWFMAAGLGLDTIKDADCRVALPMPEYLERPSSKNALQERIELEIALVTTSSPFIPALPDLGLDACLVMLSKIFGRIVETNREAALNHTCMDIITQRSLARSLDDLYASIPEVARKPDVLLAMSSTAEWALNKWKSVFALAQLLGSRVTLYRYTLLRRMERSQSAETVSSVDFVESFNAVVDTMNLIRMLEQHGASFGSLFALMLTDLFSVALTLPVCFVLPLSPSDKALADAALECLCTTLDILSNGIAPSPSYSHVIRTICASRDPEFVVRAVKLAAENMDSPSLPNDSGVPEGPQSTMLLRYFYRLSSTPSSSAPAPTPPSKPEPTGSRVLPHPLSRFQQPPCKSSLQV